MRIQILEAGMVAHTCSLSKADTEDGFEDNLSYKQVEGQSELHSKTIKEQTLNT